MVPDFGKTELHSVESQVIPVNTHNLSKGFCPNLATIIRGKTFAGFKNLGEANADTTDIKTEWRRQLYDTFTPTKLSKEAKGEFIKHIILKGFH